MSAEAGLARPVASAVALASVVGLALSFASSAMASNQLFKCVIDKRTVYQQQACPAGAEPEEAKASAPAAKASENVASKAPVRPPSRAASSEPAKPR